MTPCNSSRKTYVCEIPARYTGLFSITIHAIVPQSLDSLFRGNDGEGKRESITSPPVYAVATCVTGALTGPYQVSQYIHMTDRRKTGKIAAAKRLMFLRIPPKRIEAENGYSLHERRNESKLKTSREMRCRLWRIKLKNLVIYITNRLEREDGLPCHRRVSQ